MVRGLAGCFETGIRQPHSLRRLLPTGSKGGAADVDTFNDRYCESSHQPTTKARLLASRWAAYRLLRKYVRRY